MDLFASLVENKSLAPKTLKVRKVYVNEDPKEEKSEPCPRCWSQNRQSNVRYMFINMQEAIYKCEAANCMYPFHDFKYKNYLDQTVYYYRAVDEEILALSHFGSLLSNEASSSSDMDHSIGSPTTEFKLDFQSPDRDASAKIPGQSELNIFDSPSLSFKNLAEGFDTGFIDDILNDLGEASPEKKPTVNSSPAQSVVQLGVNKSNRQLKRCLEMFHEDKFNTAKHDSELFKVPPVPGLETSNSHKVKLKKGSPSKRVKSNRRTSQSSSPSAERILKKSRMKPLQFLETLNSIRTVSEESQQQDVSVSAQPTNKKLGNNQKVAKMLDFIERSMKKRAPIVEPVVSNTLDPLLNRTMRKTSKKKELKKRSLSEAVLHDSQFEYSSSEEEQGLSSFSIGSTSTQCTDDELSLPSFEELVHSIHPSQNNTTKESTDETANVNSGTGFRSAGCSPTRIEPWEAIPPRRIQSMESLCSLLE
ncbi:uncharacterized protein LOC128737784 [Sabethes cyaneus]|uniref:uncharacterized protein LOC128737784 n=1 Tax=Sabethes cyaneus TaxID=53552 RepID=UPI00237D659B|nr:uncharacterized protein LOC128737784 [Sabethes cyaneus]